MQAVSHLAFCFSHENELIISDNKKNKFKFHFKTEFI